MNRTAKALVAAGVLTLQCLAIGWLILRYERVVRHGTEVRLKCAARDPYDPLRGRYLRLNVSETTTNISASVNDAFAPENKFFVRIEPSTNGLWRIVEAALEPTGEGLWVKPKSSHADYCLPYSERRPDESWEDFENRRKSSPVAVSARFPDQLFLNEKLAPAAEKLMEQRAADAVAVYRVLDGEIVLTDVEIDGRSLLVRAADEQLTGKED